MIRAVMDTNVLDSALRSQMGASFEVFTALRENRWRALLSNHLLLEYEEVLKRHAGALGLTLEEIDTLLDAICARAEHWILGSGWLSVLSDPDDEPIVQLAYDSVAKRIITHNLRHFAPACSLGIQVLPPSQFAAMLPES